MTFSLQMTRLVTNITAFKTLAHNRTFTKDINSDIATATNRLYAGKGNLERFPSFPWIDLWPQCWINFTWKQIPSDKSSDSKEASMDRMEKAHV